MWTSNQLMNFCDAAFKTCVSSNTVCCEGYDVSNLLSRDTQKRNCGFLSDRFIKPPVEVTFEFPFEISLSHIHIVTQVGQQKSSGLELWSTFMPSTRNCSSKGSSGSTMEKIGYAAIDQTEKGVMFFCPQLHGRQWHHPEANMMKMRAFTWMQRGAIVHLSKLTVRILRTIGSSVPGIGRIEIWGVPSSCIPRIKMDEVKALWKSSIKPDCLKGEEAPVEKKDMNIIPRNINDSLIDNIPEDFLDAITYEVMVLPMVLPSGKIVDQRTLEHHAAAEALWGRPPSDPFTGISFKSGCQPVLDVALKGRLDRFLVLNQNRQDLKMVPRTVGRSFHSNVCNLGISSLVSSSYKTGIKRHQSIDQPKPSCLLSRKGLDDLATRVTETHENSSVKTVKRVKLGHDLYPSAVGFPCDSHTNVRGLESCQNNSEVRNSSINKVMKGNHEERINESLQSAIEAALSGLPSYVNPVVPKFNPKCCGSCKQTSGLFSLPCDHFLCRSCLVCVSKQATPACPECNTVFRSSDPSRCHD